MQELAPAKTQGKVVGVTLNLLLDIVELELGPFMLLGGEGISITARGDLLDLVLELLHTHLAKRAIQLRIARIHLDGLAQRGGTLIEEFTLGIEARQGTVVVDVRGFGLDLGQHVGNQGIGVFVRLDRLGLLFNAGGLFPITDHVAEGTALPFGGLLPAVAIDALTRRGVFEKLERLHILGSELAQPLKTLARLTGLSQLGIKLAERLEQGGIIGVMLTDDLKRLYTGLGDIGGRGGLGERQGILGIEGVVLQELVEGDECLVYLTGAELDHSGTKSGHGLGDHHFTGHGAGFFLLEAADLGGAQELAGLQEGGLYFETALQQIDREIEVTTLESAESLVVQCLRLL